MNESAGLLAGAMARMQTTLSDIRAAGAVIVGSTGVGLAELMGWLQSNIGFIGSVCGVALALVTIWAQSIAGRKALLEYRILQENRESKE